MVLDAFCSGIWVKVGEVEPFDKMFNATFNGVCGGELCMQRVGNCFLDGVLCSFKGGVGPVVGFGGSMPKDVGDIR